MGIPTIDPPKDISPPVNRESQRDIDELLHAERKKLSYREDVWLHYVRVILLLFAAAVAFFSVFIFLFHLLTPDEWRWLDAVDLARIKDLALTVIVGILASSGTSSLFKRK